MRICTAYSDNIDDPALAAADISSGLALTEEELGGGGVFLMTCYPEFARGGAWRELADSLPFDGAGCAVNANADGRGCGLYGVAVTVFIGVKAGVALTSDGADTDALYAKTRSRAGLLLALFAGDGGAENADALNFAAHGIPAFGFSGAGPVFGKSGGEYVCSENAAALISLKGARPEFFSRETDEAAGGAEIAAAARELFSRLPEGGFFLGASCGKGGFSAGAELAVVSETGRDCRFCRTNGLIYPGLSRRGKTVNKYNDGSIAGVLIWTSG